MSKPLVIDILTHLSLGAGHGTVMFALLGFSLDLLPLISTPIPPFLNVNVFPRTFYVGSI